MWVRYLVYGLPLAVFLVSISVGAYPIPIYDVVMVVSAKLASLLSTAVSVVTFGVVSPAVNLHYPTTYEVVIVGIRMPRVVFSMAVGAALALSGLILQAMFKNPLVDSYILGISSGAAFGATLAIGFLAVASVTPIAFVFALLAVFMTYSLARIGGSVTPVSLVLAGIIVNALFTALTSLLKFLMEHNRLAAAVYWLMGSFSGVGWDAVVVAVPVISVLGALAYLLRWRLDVLSFGEEAKTLGVDVEKLKALFVFVATLLTAVSVAYSGIIGWVGLMVPHIMRMAFGPSHRGLVPLTIAGGAAFMGAADTLARTIATFEIPVGILTTVLGVPFFIYLLRKTGGRWHA
ncbi:transport system permease protein [Pyrobaculum islandicum DSM 4184]|uniref:Transport system permease protein n=1 Tax=Pyrobaculum islandicum (strain DSM 4184 / JCM 9189 / GEO3) TaxID=384616 RepID=A1RR30_PYRIL|nr:iron ABC transporter permease [Pyrobaculum islandicum]ABL87412.1 transport system permease protein [Pyrobaculum islandicum DSM 4184]